MKGMLTSFLNKRPNLIANFRWICRSCEEKSFSSTPAWAGGPRIAASRNLPDQPARTRFAPSPTGYLHLGSLRTALFNYLLAKATGGQFILRIEDTDQKRTISDAEDRLCQDLEWAGLQWDEGPKIGGPFGPYKQSQRTARYRQHAETLVNSGHAYRCFCSPERLHSLAKHRSELGLPTDYDRACASIPTAESQDRAEKGEAHVIRFMVPKIYPIFNDLVYGIVRNRQARGGKADLYPAFEDPILLKSDGFPTYHLANVVDDHEMRITHVVRGAEWMSSTPKHIAMYEAFAWKPPAFAHVGLLMDENHQKLSKRNLDLDVSAFRNKMGVFPETLTNFVALLGWSHSKAKDIMSLEELVNNFSMKFTTGNTVVTFDKMWYLQKAHAGRYAAAASMPEHNTTYIKLMVDPIWAVLLGRIQKGEPYHILQLHEPHSYISKLVRADARNYTTPNNFIERNKYFFETPNEAALLATRPMLKLRSIPQNLQSTLPLEELRQVLFSLQSISEGQWQASTLRDNISGFVRSRAEATIDALAMDEDSGIIVTKIDLIKSWSKLIHSFLRWALLATRPGPDGGDTMDILGRPEVLSRLETALSLLDAEVGTIDTEYLSPTAHMQPREAGEGLQIHSDECKTTA